MMMEVEIQIKDRKAVEKYVENIIKFSRPKAKSGENEIYNIKDPHIQGLMWVVCSENKEVR